MVIFRELDGNELTAVPNLSPLQELTELYVSHSLNL